MTARPSLALLARRAADRKSAAGFSIDCLFITAGIHAEELGGRDQPNLAALNEMFADAGLAPKAVTQRLVW
jgi:hypothetical protein